MNILPRHLWKIFNKNTEHVDTVVNINQILNLPITNVISKTRNNQGPQVDCFATNLSTYSRTYQDVVYDESSYSYNRITSYPTDSVVFLGN